MLPPREFRSVATLLTLTLSRTICGVRSAECGMRSGNQTLEIRNPQSAMTSAKLLLHHVDDLLRPAADFILMPALQHHAQQRFGS